jgi:HD-GYP domain-containing protein (c-di-GMP phosphodiesterase class II)
VVTRITSVVDAFDAMTTNRPYRQNNALENK